MQGGWRLWTSGGTYSMACRRLCGLHWRGVDWVRFMRHSPGATPWGRIRVWLDIWWSWPIIRGAEGKFVELVGVELEGSSVHICVMAELYRQMTVVWASLVVGRSTAGFLVMGHKFDQSRQSWGLLFRVLVDPIVLQQLHRPRKNYVGVWLVAVTPWLVIATPGKATAALVESLIEVLVTNLLVRFVLEGLCCSLYIDVLPLTTKSKWRVKAVDSPARELLSPQTVAVVRLGPLPREPAFASRTQALLLAEYYQGRKRRGRDVVDIQRDGIICRRVDIWGDRWTFFLCASSGIFSVTKTKKVSNTNTG